MGSEHYCLRWNNHQSNLLGVFSQLLESESLVDVTLACTEGPSIRAHKVVLSACSSYFQALFLDHPNRHPIVILKDVRFAELRTLVDFMYKGEVNVEYCQLSALLKTAESLKVKGLADMTNINAAVASREDQQQQQQSQQQQQQQQNQQQQQSQQQQSQQQHDRSSECLQRESSREQQQHHRDSIKDLGSSSKSTEGNVPGVATATAAGATNSSQGTKESTEQQQQQQQQQNHPQGATSDSGEIVDMTDCPGSPTGPGSPCPGPLALDRPRRDSEDAGSLEETRGSLSPISVHSGPSDMSLSNNTAGTPGVLPLNLPQSRLPSPHSTEPLAGPSGLPPVQQVPLSLKKEMDWERSTEERSASSEISTDYRLPPDPVSLALGLEAGGWGALVERSSSHHHHHHGGSGPGGGGATALISHGSFASLAGLARRCGVCLATFPSAWLLERHALLQHAGQSSDDKPFTCEQCGQRYRYRSAYVKHREQNHRARLPADKLFTCDVCGMQFRYLKSFKKHRLNHALERLQRAPSDTHNAVLTSPSAERSDQVSSTGEPSQIETGSDSTTNPGDGEESRGIVFSENARGEESISETASIQENPSDAQLEIQMTESSLNETAASTGGTPAAVAAAATAANDAVIGVAAGNTAEVVADVDESVVDDERSEPQDAMISLARSGHEADRRERRFACPFCGKCVRSKENLKLHVRKHTGERPFVCLFCGRAFGGKSDLTRHLRIHTGERPYHCEMCGKCFARADYLSKHLTTHIHQR